MRELRFQPKIAKSADLPVWLIQFFTRVNKMIQRKDEAVTRASDDFIQQRGVVGGLVEEGGDIYEFTVFPGPDNSYNRPRWHVTMSAETIGKIANRKLTHLDLWECSNTDCQNLFSTSDKVCMYCDYFDDRRDARNRVKVELSKLEFGTKEEWVRLYLDHFPGDNSLVIIGQYNSTGFGEHMGWFSMEEIDAVVDEYKAHAHDRSGN